MLNANQPINTVMFSIMEAKDFTRNLFLCLDIEQFLCAIYGLFGAGGRHPCLRCEISSDMLEVKLLDRDGK